eukprot:UN10273
MKIFSLFEMLHKSSQVVTMIQMCSFHGRKILPIDISLFRKVFLYVTRVLTWSKELICQ